ncbi:MAG: hypothetical protein GY757_29065, partial [bacterium]|nr:hypothetical protein [bacterium]
MPRKNYPVLLCVILLIVNLAFLRGADNHNHEHPEGHSHGECEAPKNKEDNPEKTKKLITIGLFLDVSCVARNIDDHMHEELQMPGYDYGHVHGGDHSHTALNAGKGFNLNYGELVLSASPGKYFDIYTVFHLSEHAFEIEEAYLATRSLPYGFRLKAGKFFSAFGRINAIHAHRRNFTCQPLIYRAFFGCHGLWEKGIQISWKAPVDFLLNLSVEALQGENAHSFGSEGFHVIDADTEDQLEIPTPQLPNLYNLMVDTAIETGPFHVSAGLSYALGKSRFNFFEDDEHSHGFAGNNRILGIDFSAHYDFDRHRYLLLQAEFLTRKLDGTRYARHV